MPKNKKFKQDPAAAINSFSKNLLGLKFMQRAKKEVEEVVQDKDESFDSSLCKDIKNKPKFIMNPSYQFCERLKFGRLSFKGMNTEIETIMYNKKQESEPVKTSGKRTSPPSETSSDNEIDNLDSDSDDDDNILDKFIN